MTASSFRDSNLKHPAQGENVARTWFDQRLNKAEVARGEVTRGDVTRGKVARGKVTRGEVARGEVARDEVAWHAHLKLWVNNCG